MFKTKNYLKKLSFYLFLLLGFSPISSNAHIEIPLSYTNSFFNNITSGGTIQSDQSICFGEDPTTLLSLSPASGGNAALPIEYLWMQSVPGVSGWEIISDATGESYTPPALNQTTAFMRCARRMGFANYTGETNVVLITVLSSPITAFTELPIGGTNGEVLSFAAWDLPFIDYTWDFGDGNTASGSSVTHTYEFGGSYDVMLTTVDNFTGCSFTISTEVEILGPLPVEYAYFYSELINDRAIHLFWETLSEEQNHLFEIQKSYDGIDFRTIGSINGNGTTASNSSYQFIDDAPLNGINYYRLKQIDYSGEFDFSEILSVHIDRGPIQYTHFPNPAQNELSVRLKELQDFETIITISDLSKNVIRQFSIAPQALKADIDISDLAPGAYILGVHSRRIRSTSLFVKVRP